MSRYRLFAAVSAAAVVAVVAASPAIQQIALDALVHFAPSWAFVVAGILLWRRRPENRAGRTMVIVGVLAGLPAIQEISHPVTWTIGSLMAPAWMIAFAYLLFSFPRGELSTPFERVFVGAVAVQVVAGQVAIHLFYPSETYPGRAPGLNLLMIRGDEALWREIAIASNLLGLATFAVAVVALARRWHRATVAARRVLAPVYGTGLASIGIVIILIIATNIRGGGIPLGGVVGSLVMAALPFALAIGLLRARWRRARIGDLVAELGEVPGPAAFEKALARTLGDPSLTVGFWSPEVAAYVCASGDPLRLPTADATAVVTYLDRGAEPLAAIVHDDALLEDPGLLRAVAAAARLAAENDRLHAELERQLEEVRESRMRLVNAADAERRRVERNLHDGAQARLVSLSLALNSIEMMLGQPDREHDVRHAVRNATDAVGRALAEIRELGRGIHPAVLTDGGLAAAVEDLALRSSLPVVVSQMPEERLSAACEVAAYFVVAEALANAAKHSSATSVRVTAQRRGSSLLVEVLDDGVGGASMAVAAGLRGMDDRVAALGGRLSLDSPPGAGTRLIAEIPCA